MMRLETKKSLLIVSAALGISYLGYQTLKIYLRRTKYRHIPGPKTKGLLGFFVGNADAFANLNSNDKYIAKILYDWAEEYGKVYKFQLGPRISVVVTEPEAIKEILVTKNFPKFRMMYKNFGFPLEARFMGKGLVTEIDNERWKHRRSLFNPAFSRQVLMAVTNDFNGKTDILLEKLRLIADGKTMVSLFEEFNNAALDVIASIGFGMNFDAINNPDNKLHALITKTLNGGERQFSEPFILLNPLNWKYLKDYKKTVEELRKIGRDQVLARIKLLQESEYVPNDLLSIILKSFKQENEKIDIEDMVDEFITFFVAGQETTANTLSFCFLEIHRNPHVIQKLREEFDQVLGSRTEIKFEDLNELNYTTCVIKETLRLWPPANFIGRYSTCELNVNGVIVPKGSWIQFPPYATSRMNFEEPLVFNPERFQKDENQKNYQNYAYLPFSLGPRVCIGQNFAMIEMKIMLAKLLQNLEFELDPTQSFEVVEMGTLRPVDGVRCHIKLRNN